MRSRPYRLTVPGLVPEETEVGLGDLVKRATERAGIKACSGCQRRAERLNELLTVSGRRSGGGPQTAASAAGERARTRRSVQPGTNERRSGASPIEEHRRRLMNS